MKRVTDPLNDRVKAQIVGHNRLHEIHIEKDDVSEIVFEFPENDADAGDYSPGNDSGSDRNVICNSDSEFEDEIETVICRRDDDSFRNVLASRVSEAVELLLSTRLSLSKSILTRHVTAYLRDFGYNSAICQTKWEKSDGITAGDHEFIDVLRLSDATRYIIGLDFSAEFEIARATNRYEILMRSLPNIFVGESGDLKKIVRAMSKAARRSFKSRGLHLPPWRKHRFMENKWFGAYRRSTNFRPSMELVSPLEQGLAVKCRSVGFDAAASRRLLFPAVTPTR